MCSSDLVRAQQVGIRAGLPVGNPFYWSMSSLVRENYFDLKMNCANLPRILFTPYPIHSDLGAILPLFVFNGSSDRRQSSKSLGSRGWVLSSVSGQLCSYDNSEAEEKKCYGSSRNSLP